MAVHAALELCAPMVIRLRRRYGREEGERVRRTLKKKKKKKVCLFVFFLGHCMRKKKGRWFARRRYEKVNLKKRMVNGWREGVAISVLGFKYSSVSQMCNRVEFPGTVWILIFSGFHVCLLEKFPRSCGVQEKNRSKFRFRLRGLRYVFMLKFRLIFRSRFKSNLYTGTLDIGTQKVPQESKLHILGRLSLLDDQCLVDDEN